MKSDRLIIDGLNGNGNGIHLKLFNKLAEARQLVDRIVKESKFIFEVRDLMSFDVCILVFNNL